MLYLVPTPVGNLEDITLRALRILKEVDVIACEDTRSSSVLLKHFGIDTPRTSYHEHNERSKAALLVRRMQSGESVALISDAGTPGISDPGFYLVRECVRNDVAVTALPGASAVLPAVTASGFPCDRFAFEGFLPVKKGRRKRLEGLGGEPRTIVLYEGPHRLARTLEDLATTLGGNRRAAVVRELSKKFEEIRRGTLTELMNFYSQQDKIRGEIVIVVEGA
jgi:16S rRNA (cytidine1402-2'-O)-methyltransferase